MGTTIAHNTKAYWNSSDDMALYLPVKRAISLVRFSQIKRYLKISDSRNEPDSKEPFFFRQN
jgi:hypothetical protein